MLRGGYLRVFSVLGADVRFHATLPLGLLFFSRFTWAPGAFLGFLAVVLIHELGHALLVRRYGLRVLSIDLHAFGGACRYAGGASEWETSVIAWGGVLAQALLLGVVELVVALSGGVRGLLFVHDLVGTLVLSNVVLIAINLLPLPGLDGRMAWRLPILLFRERGAARTKRVPLPEHEGETRPDAVSEIERIIREEAAKKRRD